MNKGGFYCLVFKVVAFILPYERVCVNIHPDIHVHVCVCFLKVFFSFQHVEVLVLSFKALQFTVSLKLGEPWRTFCLRVLLNPLETHNY